MLDVLIDLLGMSRDINKPVDLPGLENRRPRRRRLSLRETAPRLRDIRRYANPAENAGFASSAAPVRADSPGDTGPEKVTTGYVRPSGTGGDRPCALVIIACCCASADAPVRRLRRFVRCNSLK